MKVEAPRRLAHDLRAPLGAMFMWMDVLRTARPAQRPAALAALYESARAHAKALDELLGMVIDPNAQLGPLPDSDVDLAGLRVLVVDDDDLMRDGLSVVLEERGVRATVAASAEEAFAIAEAGELLDAIVCDVSMPGEDGCSLLRRIRASTTPAASVPAIALTALARPEDRLRAVNAGFDVMLAKPAEPEILRRVIARLTGREVAHRTTP